MPCPVADECGGCDWTALRLDKQLEAKQRILTESLRRIGKIDPATLPPIAMHPSPLNYRLRIRLHRDGDEVGFYAMRIESRRAAARAECEVVGLQHARASPRDGRDVGSRRQRIDHRRARYDPIDGYSRLDRRVLPGQPPSARHDAAARAGHAARARRTRHAPSISTPASASSALPIAEHVRERDRGRRCRVRAQYAKRNVPANVKLVAAPVEWWVERMPRADFVFLDPPRSGSAARTSSTPSPRRANEMICYLACDPVTFARDASRLIASGWRLSTLDLLDLFPNTHHVETLSSFERAR